MSPRAPRVCLEPNCTRLTPNTRCEEHTRKAWDGPRTASTQRTGRRSWRKIRAKVLCRDLVCQLGFDGWTTKPEEVHHITEVADGGSDTHANLIGVCKSCHAKITAQRASEVSHGAPRRAARRAGAHAHGGPPSDNTAGDRARVGDRPEDRAREVTSRIPHSIIARY